MGDIPPKVRRVSLLATEEERNRQAQPAKWTETHVSGGDFDAVREERITVLQPHISPDVWALFSGYQRLHIRWVRPATYDTLAPLAARVPPGLHVLVTLEGAQTPQLGEICTLLKDTFKETGCVGNESFTSVSDTQFQFYSPLKQTPTVGPKQAEALCGSWSSQGSCKPFFESLTSAAWFDINWDSGEQKLKLSSMRPLETRTLHEIPYDDCSTEISLFSRPQFLHTGSGQIPIANRERPDEVTLEGPLHRIEPGARMNFAFTSATTRHKNHDGTYSVSFADPTGLHPTMRILASTHHRPGTYDENVKCGMYAYLTLPRTIFADRYQLQDPLFLESKNLAALTFSSEDVDLEAPEYTVKTWGSTVLLELAPNSEIEPDGEWAAEIPLHLRYMKPAAGGYSGIEVPYPTIFWACNLAHGDGPAMGPWDILDFGYDSFFQPGSTFWHLQPAPEAGKDLYSVVNVPVADTEQTNWVPLGTAIAVALGTLWVVWSLMSAWFGAPSNTAKVVAIKKDAADEKTSTKEPGSKAGNLAKQKERQSSSESASDESSSASEAGD